MRIRSTLRSVVTGVLSVLVGGLCLAMMMGQGCVPNGDGNGTATSQFLGASECRLCHSSHYNDWLETSHASALQTLKAIGQDRNAFCLGCHTVGHGEQGGFVSEASTPHLAGVQCENCHGPGFDHRSNVDDRNARPPRSIASSVCGKCHNNTHHPTLDEWERSAHAGVHEELVPRFASGSSLSTCGVCHSGDYRDAKFIEELPSVPETLLSGKTEEEMHGVTCVICHDPHKRTENAVESGPDKDYQLRYSEVAYPTRSNSIAVLTDSSRYNLCGQCHRSRGRVWSETTRPMHHSIQSNMFYGEMPLPNNDQTPLVANTNTAHRFVPKQCVTCHMPTVEFDETLQLADSGHDFAPNLEGCSGTGCHPSADSALQDMEALQARVDEDLAAIYDRLGTPSTWEYTSEGGPSDQSGISDEIKKIRFLYYWVLYDGSKGVHNPEYTRAILTSIDVRLTALGK